MEIKQKTNKTHDAVNRINIKGTLHFMDVANRNLAFELIKKAGIAAKKSVSSNNSIHPEYVEDYVGEIETGFGNSMYQTLFLRLYTIKINGE